MLDERFYPVVQLQLCVFVEIMLFIHVDHDMIILQVHVRLTMKYTTVYIHVLVTQLAQKLILYTCTCTCI